MTLDIVHLTPELAENESLFIWMTINHTEEGLHLVRAPLPLCGGSSIFESHTIHVHLGMNHTLPGTEKTLQNDHVLGVEALSISESLLDGLLSFGKHKLVEGLLLWEHLKFHILKVTRRKGKTLIDLSQVFFGPAEDVDVLDLLGSSLNKVLGDAQKGAKIHKVIHRVEHWCSSDQPLDIRSEITNNQQKIGKLPSKSTDWWFI